MVKTCVCNRDIGQSCWCSVGQVFERPLYAVDVADGWPEFNYTRYFSDEAEAREFYISDPDYWRLSMVLDFKGGS